MSELRGWSAAASSVGTRRALGPVMRASSGLHGGVEQEQLSTGTRLSAGATRTPRIALCRLPHAQWRMGLRPRFSSSSAGTWMSSPTISVVDVPGCRRISRVDSTRQQWPSSESSGLRALMTIQPSPEVLRHAHQAPPPRTVRGHQKSVRAPPTQARTSVRRRTKPRARAAAPVHSAPRTTRAVTLEQRTGITIRHPPRTAPTYPCLRSTSRCIPQHPPPKNPHTDHPQSELGSRIRMTPHPGSRIWGPDSRPHSHWEHG